MPFYMVQLVPHNYDGAHLQSLPLVIEAQYQVAAELQRVGIATTTDLGNSTYIHPDRKRKVEDRLAWLALTNDYGIEELPAFAPTYQSMSFQEGKLILSFNHTSDSRCWNDGRTFLAYLPDGVITLGGFEVAERIRVLSRKGVYSLVGKQKRGKLRQGCQPSCSPLCLP